MDRKEPIYANGFYAKAKSPKTPEWIIAKFGIKIDELDWFRNAVANAKESGEEWLNFDIKEGKTGKMYIELDTFKPQKKGGSESSEIPF